MLVFKLTSEHFARNAPKAVVSLQHRDLSRIQKLYFASLGILNFQIPLYLTVYSILTKKQCGRPTGNLLKEADQEVHTTR